MAGSIKKVSLGGHRYHLERLKNRTLDASGKILKPDESPHNSPDAYLTSAKEPPGRWFVSNERDASFLGIQNGKVFDKSDDDIFSTICKGFHPKSGIGMVDNPGQIGRIAYTDFVFSPDKSVSAIWGLASSELREVIATAQADAFTEALDLLNDRAIITRRRKGGRIKENVGMIAARFEHGSSRTDDFQLHEHAAILNICVRADGTTGTIDNHSLFVWQGAAMSLCHASFACRLAKIGFEVERSESGGNFAIKGIPDDLLKAFSQRTKDVEFLVAEKAAEMGVRENVVRESRKIMAELKLQTRQAKNDLTRDELYEQWAERAQAFDFDADKVSELAKTPPRSALTPEMRQQLLEDIQENLTFSKATFSEPQIVSAVAIALMGYAEGDEILAAVEDVKKDLLHAYDEKGYTAYTTRDMLLIEASMIQKAGEKVPPATTREKVGAIIDRKATMTEEQAEALRQVMVSDTRVAVLQGGTGIGQTYPMEAVAEAYKAEGFRVEAIAQNWTAAGNLRIETNLDSHRAISGWLKDLAIGNIQLNERTVVVLDDAGLVGSRDMSRIIDEVQRAGARLVLTGDERPFSSIEAGDALRCINDRYPGGRIETIRRQRDAGDREAVKGLFERDPSTALRHWHERITIGESTEDTNKQMFDAWARSMDEHGDDMSHIMIARENRDVAALNRSAHEKLRVEGKLGSEVVYTEAVESYKEAPLVAFRAGDAIQFRTTRRELNIYNRTRGTITSVHPEVGLICVEVGENERAREVLVDISDRKWNKEGRLQLQHCYALNSFSSQGQTLDRVFFRDSTKTDFRAMGVALSRHRHHLEIFVSRAEHLNHRSETGIDWVGEFTNEHVRTQLAETWARNSRKTSTLDFDYWEDSTGAYVSATSEEVRREADAVIERARQVDMNAACRNINFALRRAREKAAAVAKAKIEAEHEANAAAMANSPLVRRAAMHTQGMQETPAQAAAPEHGQQDLDKAASAAAAQEQDLEDEQEFPREPGG